MSRGRRRCAALRRGRPIELGEMYDSAYAGEGVGNDRLTLLAQFEGDDERWSALHAPQDYRDSGSKAAPNRCSRLQIKASCPSCRPRSFPRELFVSAIIFPRYR